MTVPSSAAASPDAGSASQNETPSVFVSVAVTYPPTSAKAPWPMLMRPIVNVSQTPRLMKLKMEAVASTPSG